MLMVQTQCNISPALHVFCPRLACSLVGSCAPLRSVVHFDTFCPVVAQIVHTLPQPHRPPVPIIHHVTRFSGNCGAHLRPNVLAGINRFRWGDASVFPHGTVRYPTTFPKVLTCSITARHSDRIATGLVRSFATSLACGCTIICIDELWCAHACAYYAVLPRQQWVQSAQVARHGRVHAW